jgi:hypothetical protein
MLRQFLHLRRDRDLRLDLWLGTHLRVHRHQNLAWLHQNLDELRRRQVLPLDDRFHPLV